MKAYKGFDRDMKCRDFQYSEGEAYETSRVKVCEAGFRACRNPVDCLAYYTPGAGSVYHEVALSGKVEEPENADDTKVAASRIRIGKRLSVADMVEAAYAYVRAKCKRGLVVRRKHFAIAGKNGCASVRDHGVAFAGENGVAKAGWGGTAFAAPHGVARVGNSGMATVRKCGAVSAGTYSVVAVGEGSVASAERRSVIAAGMFCKVAAGDSAVVCVDSCGAASVGNCGVAVASEYGMADAGDFGLAVAGGIASCGDYGAAVAYGSNARVKGGLGAILTIVHRRSVYNSVRPGSWTIYIDADKYKPDTWYTVKAGAVVEADE